MTVTPDDNALLQSNGIFFLMHFAAFTTMTLLYGIFVLLFAAATYIFLRRGIDSRSRRVMFTIIVVSFLLNTLYWASWVACFAIDTNSKFVANVEKPLVERFRLAQNKLHPLEVLQFLSFVLPIILSDAVVMWRAWAILSDKRWVMIAPFFLLFGTIALALTSFAIDAAYSTPTLGSSKAKILVIVIISTIGASMGANLLATLLIAYKLWTHRKFISNLGLRKRHSRVQSVLILLVESGVIYCAVQLLDLLLAFAKIGLYPNSQRLATSYVGPVFDSIYAELSAMYPTIVVLIVNNQHSMTDTFCLNTTLSNNTEGHPPGTEHRPETVGHLSFVVRSTETRGTVVVESPPVGSIIEEGLKRDQSEK